MNKLQSCLTIVNLLQMQSPLTSKEICERFKDYSPDGKTLNSRQFFRHKTTIEEIMPCKLKCRNGKYSLEWNEKITGDKVTGGLWGRLLANAELAEMIQLMSEQSNKIALLQPPSGEIQLRIVILAMKKKQGICGAYTSRSSDNPTPKTMTLYPVFVALWDSRWYMVAECPSHPGNLAVYALERFDDLYLTKEKYKCKSTIKTAKKYFENQYGIYGPSFTAERKPEEIIMEVEKKQLLFLQDPLFHPSLKVIEDNEVYSIVSLYLVPNENFYQKILGFGKSVKILSPESVKNEIISKIKELSVLYRLGQADHI